MNVYFVRHGQSIFNATDTHQLPTTPLSPLGEQQAEFVAKRFLSIPVERIYSSDLMRAKQTAQAIQKSINKPLIFSELIRERKRPSEILGKNYADEHTKKITDLIEHKLDDSGWHYSDEENFFDIKKRARKFLDFLEDVSEENVKNVAVVTHGAFLKMVLLTIIFGDDFDSHVFQAFYSNAKTTNTGITVAEYKENNWSMRTFNDYAHLGD